MRGGLIEHELLALHVKLRHQCDVYEFEQQTAVLVLDDPDSDQRLPLRKFGTSGLGLLDEVTHRKQFYSVVG